MLLDLAAALVDCLRQGFDGETERSGSGFFLMVLVESAFACNDALHLTRLYWALCY